MKFVPVRDLRIRPGGVFRKLREVKELVVTSRGKPIAVMAAASEDNLEEILAGFRDSRALAGVRRIQAHSVERGLNRMTMQEIDAEIQAARRERRKRDTRRAGPA